jgi:hypothetical protein
MQDSYEITPRSAELGGGWRLRLLEDGEEAGGGVFPIASVDPHQGMTWWNARSEKDRAHWLLKAASARPADAYHAFLLAQAYDEAEAEGLEWVASRDG